MQGFMPPPMPMQQYVAFVTLMAQQPQYAMPMQPQFPTPYPQYPQQQFAPQQYPQPQQFAPQPFAPQPFAPQPYAPQPQQYGYQPPHPGY
jgi:hypothetical protein